MKKKHQKLQVGTVDSGTVARPIHVVVDFPWDASACMGTGAYSETMVRAMAGASPESRFTLVVPSDGKRTIDLPNVKYASLPKVELRQEGARQIALPAFLAESQADCLFAPATLLPLSQVCPMVATVHDLLFLRHPEYYSSGLVEYLNRWAAPSLRAADHLVAISPEAKADLVELLAVPEERISIIRQPVRETFEVRLASAEVDGQLRTLGVAKPFFFHVSNLSPHKNTSFAIQAFAEFLRANPRSNCQLLFAGGGIAPNRPTDLKEAARQFGVEKRVHYVGRITDLQLKALYQSCEAFLFPSLAEGWGLPVAEAGALGARILSSPHVPAAAEGQRLKLDLRLWVAGMGNLKVGRESLQPVAFKGAGEALLEVFRRAVAGGASRAIVPTSTASPQGVRPRPSEPTPRLAGLSGCTIIRNGTKLRYPFEESVASYAPMCDEVVISWDPTSEDDTAALVRRIADRFPNVRLIESVWDMSNRQEGSELARQTQIAFGHCRHEWTVYIQADEALHERYHETLRSVVADPRLAGIAFRRVSFFESLEREIPEHRTRGMVRMFRTGYGRSLGDAMHVLVEGHSGRVAESEATLYNYSRLGSSEDIVTRCTNLHRFYHDESWLAARSPDQELEIQTIPYEESHPAPIEESFRRPIQRLTRRGPRVSAHVIVQERDTFGSDLLGSCLDTLEDYADQIVVVDNGLGREALNAVLSRRKSLPITFVDGRDVTNDFAELRNRALAATAPDMTHIHKIDSDEVYLPGPLQELKELLQDPSIEQANASFVHFMIEPTLLESVQGKEVVFRRSESLAWRGPVHEQLNGIPQGRVINSPACFLHFGYCRPQWQTMLKWLKYAVIQGSDLSHYKYEFLDGVRRPWFRDGRTPDTILEPRRSRLEAYKDSYPPAVRPWLEKFAQSGLQWGDWVNQRSGSPLWDIWQKLVEVKGSWEDTLEEMLRRWSSPGEAEEASRGSTSAPGPSTWEPPASLKSEEAIPGRTNRNEFRRGFSIIIPTWNNLTYLQKAVESIRAYSDFDHEIVVHVNDGNDGTLAWVREEGLKHTHTPENVGICVAMNKVTDLCSRDLVMYYNDDMVALPEWDRHIVAYAESHKIDTLTWLSSTLIEPTGDNPSFIAPADYGTSVETFDEARLVRDLPGMRERKGDMMGTSWAPNLLYLETFNRVGRMSEEFSPGFGSDPDLAKKLWDIGMRHFVGVGRSLVYHFQCKGTGKIPKHLHNDAQGTFYRKHGLSIHDFIFGVLRRLAQAPEKLLSARTLAKETTEVSP